MGHLSRRQAPVGTFVGRQLSLPLSPQQSNVLTALCRRYAVLDERGAARGVELVRVLLAVSLTPSASAKSTAHVAARINAKMMVAAMGSRLSRPLGATVANGETPMVIGSHLRITLDSWLQQQLDRFAPGFRDGHGRVARVRLVVAALAQGLADPRLDEVLRYYAPMINPFRSRVVLYQKEIERALGALAHEWAASAAA